MRPDWESIPLFAGLDAAALDRLQSAARRHVYPAGAFLFREGEPSAGFFIIVDGMVRLYRSNPEGRLHTLSLLRAPSAFNEVAAVDGGTNPFHALAVTAVEVFALPHHSLFNLMATERTLMANAMQALARLNRETLERLEDMTFRTIPSRLAKLFLHESTYGDQICEMPSQLTQEEMAAILGTTREVVGRALRGLLNAGLLVKRGRFFVIADADGLMTLAETNELPQKLTHVKP
jgi:CRP/FNR family transcriptional regulator